jgi:oligopeptide/dipeptide ABC transporter ATP-binding protein
VPATASDILSIRNLTVEYRRAGRHRVLRALDDVSLTLRQGQTVGIVGESGSGKSTLGKAILGLAPVYSGTIELNGQDITHLRGRERRALSHTAQVVFQDPYSSLNPARTIGQTLRQPLTAGGAKAAAGTTLQARVEAGLDAVRLPASVASSYPSALSGGQRQRVAIARALMTSPNLVVCDEAVASLDLPIQAQVINLLRDLQERTGIGYLFITHDLAVVRHIADWIVVLYKGRIMESGPTEQICTNPTHPYTQGLVLAAPVPDVGRQAARRATRQALRPPADASRQSAGCAFAPRCYLATDVCWQERPADQARHEAGACACHHADQAAPATKAVPAQAMGTVSTADRKEAQ